MIQRAIRYVGVSDFAVAKGHGINNRFLINGEIQRLTHFHFSEIAVGVIDQQMVFAGGGIQHDVKFGVFLQR